MPINPTGGATATAAPTPQQIERAEMAHARGGLAVALSLMTGIVPIFGSVTKDLLIKKNDPMTKKLLVGLAVAALPTVLGATGGLLPAAVLGGATLASYFLAPAGDEKTADELRLAKEKAVAAQGDGAQG